MRRRAIDKPAGGALYWGREETMDRRTGQGFVALFVLGCLLFNYPMLELFERPVLVAGVPLIYAYLFGAWALLIALGALIARRME
jgi:hypothetical protein